MRLTRRDDEAVLRTAYAEHGAELLRFARRALHDGGLAEEAVQETFLRAWRAADRFDPRLGSLRTWLFAICRNVLADLARARAVRPVLTSQAVDPPAVVDELEHALMSFQIDEALQRLSEHHRVALVEVHLRGRPVAEVARELNVPTGTVHSRLFYGLRALGLVLEEIGWLDEP